MLGAKSGYVAAEAWYGTTKWGASEESTAGARRGRGEVRCADGYK
jgi:hypothetical protein